MQHVLIEYDTNTGALLGVYGSLEAVKAARPGVVFRCPFEPDLDAPEYNTFDARSPDGCVLRYEIRPVRGPHHA